MPRLTIPWRGRCCSSVGEFEPVPFAAYSGRMTERELHRRLGAFSAMISAPWAWLQVLLIVLLILIGPTFFVFGVIFYPHAYAIGLFAAGGLTAIFLSILLNWRLFNPFISMQLFTRELERQNEVFARNGNGFEWVYKKSSQRLVLIIAEQGNPVEESAEGISDLSPLV